MTIESSLYSRFQPSLVAEVLSDISLGPNKVAKHMEASHLLHTHIDDMLEHFKLGESGNIRTFLDIRGEYRRGWLRQIGGTQEDAVRVAQQIVSCTEDTPPDGCACHLCGEAIELDPAVVVNGFNGHRACVVDWVADLLPTRFDFEATLCPCGCGTDLLGLT